MKASRLYLGLVALFAGILLMALSTNAVSATPPDPEHKVTICHRTNSDTNPYVQIEVDEAAVDGQGGADHYGEHKGPIWNPTLKDQKIEWGDIIPPVSPFHEGLNWTTEGRAIYDNGCKILGETTTTGPTTTEPVTTTTVEVTTTTETPTTTLPNVTTKAAAVDAAAVDAAAIARPVALPRTGRTAWPLAATGLGLIAAGGLLLNKQRVLN